jgi:hypothetical protein
VKRAPARRHRSKPLYRLRAEGSAPPRTPSRRREENKAGDEEPFGAEPVPESAGGQDQAGEDYGVSIDQTLQSRDSPDAFEGDVHNGDVELHRGKADQTTVFTTGFLSRTDGSTEPA